MADSREKRPSEHVCPLQTTLALRGEVKMCQSNCAWFVPGLGCAVMVMAKGYAVAAYALGTDNGSDNGKVHVEVKQPMEGVAV